MQQKTSSQLNMTLKLTLDIIKRNRGLCIIYTVFLLICCPLLSYLTMNGDVTRYLNPMYPSSYTPVIHYEYVIGLAILGIIAATIISQMVSRYLHNGSSMDMYYSLPIKKENLYISHFVGGLTVVIAPIIFTLVVFLGISSFFSTKYGFIFETANTVEAIALILVCILVVYSISIFVSTLVGNTFDSFVISTILNFIVPIVSIVTIEIFSMYIFGYYSDSSVGDIVLNCTSPIISLFNNFFNISSFNSTQIIKVCVLWFIVSLILIVGGLFIAKQRKSELAGKSRPNDIIQTIIKICVCYIFGLLFMAIIMSQTVQDSQKLSIGMCILYIIGSAITFVFCHAILSRGFHTVLKSWKQFLIVVSSGLLVLIIANTGGLGYENRIPTNDSVKSVTIDRSVLNIVESKYYPGIQELTHDTFNYEPLVLESENAISSTTNFHKEMLANGKDYNSDYYNYISNIYIYYQLNNGFNMTRSYMGNMEKLYNYIDKIKVEINEAYNPIFLLDQKDIKAVTIKDILDTNINYISLSSDQKQELINALSEDMCNEIKNNLYDNPGDIICKLDLETISRQKSYTSYSQTEKIRTINSSINIRPWYENTLNLLKKLGYDKHFSTNLDKISKAYVVDVKDLSIDLDGIPLWSVKSSIKYETYTNDFSEAEAGNGTYPLYGETSDYKDDEEELLSLFPDKVTVVDNKEEISKLISKLNNTMDRSHLYSGKVVAFVVEGNRLEESVFYLLNE